MQRSLPFLLAAVVLVAASTSCGVRPEGRLGWTDPSPGPFVTGPYILLGGQRNAFIAVKSPATEPAHVEWWVAPEDAELGDVPDETRRVRARRYEDLWVARLENLPVGPRIGYRVVSPRGRSSDHYFRVGPRPGQPFRFAAFGDTRTNHSVHRAVIDALAREKVDFVVHTGDMVAYGGKQDSWDRFFQIERPLLTDAPIIPAIGNHDLGARDYYRRYFLHDMWTGGPRYFVMDWGPVRIVALDIGVEGRSGSDQFAFAEQALAEGARRGMLMVVALHFPPYSSGRHGSQKDVQRIIVPLARRYGVELVIAGHDHDYERTIPLEGTTYVVSGSAGAPIRPVDPQWFTAEARTEPHYVLIDVEDGRIALRAVNLQGDTFDTQVIPPNPPRPN